MFIDSIQEQQLQEKLSDWGFWTEDKIAYYLLKKDRELCIYLLEEFLLIDIENKSQNNKLELSVQAYYDWYQLDMIYQNIKYLIDTL